MKHPQIKKKRQYNRWGVIMCVSWLSFIFTRSTLTGCGLDLHTRNRPQISCQVLKYFMNTCPGGQDGGNSLRWNLHQYAMSGCCSEQQELNDLWKLSLDSSGRESTSHKFLGFSTLQTQRMLSRFLHVTQYSTFNIRTVHKTACTWNQTVKNVITNSNILAYSYTYTYTKRFVLWGDLKFTQKL